MIATLPSLDNRTRSTEGPRVKTDHLRSAQPQPLPSCSETPSNLNFGGMALDSVPQRIREIAMLRGLGYSFREIATPLHVSPQAVSLMLSRHRRSLQSLRGAMELSNLSARAVNALGRHGIHTREEARRRDALGLLKNARNCGRKTLEEIAFWIGADR
jgi:predicted transcriptional regulator